MLISYEWLKELTDTKLSPAELRERLTMVGLAIDAVEDQADDAVLDVEVPSNRPDCLSHVGIAREVAVIENGQLRLPAGKPPKTEGRSANLTSVEIKDPDLCPRYAARLVRGVKIGPSPDWLAKRLETIGQRPINNVADITNYVLHELGQPLHAFDFEKLGGRRIVVRRAAPGEKLKTLDGVERTLTGDMLVIADAEKARGACRNHGWRRVGDFYTDHRRADRECLLRSTFSQANCTSIRNGYGGVATI